MKVLVTSSLAEINALDAVKIEIEDTAPAKKSQLLESAKTITAIENEFDYECAIEVQRSLKTTLADVESARASVKAPVLALGKRIDSTARDYCAGIDTEADRIAKLINKFNADKEAKRQEEERKRQAEIARIERERLQAEAEAKRKADREAAQARNEAERKEAQERAAAAAKLAAEQAEKQKAEIAKQTPLTPEKVARTAVKTVWRHEVTDLSKVYAHNPALVRMEPNTAAINAEIARGVRELPGVRIWSEVVTEVRR